MIAIISEKVKKDRSQMQGLVNKPAKNVMQSGLGNTTKWLLTFVKTKPSVQENLMGHASSLDNSNQVKIYFSDKNKATEFALKYDIKYQLKENNIRKRIKKSYTNNFTKDLSLYYY